MDKPGRPLDPRAIQRLQRRIAEIGDHALDRSAPLYFEDAGGRLRFLASAFLLGVADHRFLVTAAHANDETLQRPLYSGGKDELVPVGGHWRVSRAPASGRDADHLDLAILHLEGPALERLRLLAVFPRETDPAHVPDPAPITGSYYVCVGFPAGRQSTWVTDAGLAPKQLYLTLKPGAAPETFGSSYNSRHNLVLEFDKDSGMTGSTGQPSVAPDPVGMSGGGVWACDGLVGPTPREPRLVGVTTTWRKRDRVIIGTRIGLCFDAIAEWFPDLARELPLPR